MCRSRTIVWVRRLWIWWRLRLESPLSHHPFAPHFLNVNFHHICCLFSFLPSFFITTRRPGIFLMFYYDRSGSDMHLSGVDKLFNRSGLKFTHYRSRFFSLSLKKEAGFRNPTPHRKKQVTQSKHSLQNKTSVSL